MGAWPSYEIGCGALLGFCLYSQSKPKKTPLLSDVIALPCVAGRVPAPLPPSSEAASLRRPISPLAAPAVTKCDGGQQTVEEES